MLEPSVFLNDRGDILPGIVGEVGLHRDVKSRRFEAKVGYAGSFLHPDKDEFLPVYENLSWGKWKRYSLHDGHLAFIKFGWRVHENIRLFSNYFAQTRDFGGENSSDEINLGIKSSYRKKYLIEISYIGLNFIGDNVPKQGINVGIRMAF
jgi:hypothetical protein